MVKLFMKATGLDMGNARLPLAPSEPETIEAFKKEMIAAGFGEFFPK